MQEKGVHTHNIDFRAIVDEHKRSVYALAYELTGNHHDAEDLSQDVFIRVYRSLSSFRGDAKMFSWLYRITVNSYLNKKQKKTLLFRKLTSDFKDVELSHAEQNDSGDMVLVNAHLDQAMKKLTPSERAAFVLRHTKDLSIREVAEAMEIADGTVKSLLHRALKKLRKSLAHYREDLGLPTA